MQSPAYTLKIPVKIQNLSRWGESEMSTHKAIPIFFSIPCSPYPFLGIEKLASFENSYQIWIELIQLRAYLLERFSKYSHIGDFLPHYGCSPWAFGHSFLK